jgi:hypothetical protein
MILAGWTLTELGLLFAGGAALITALYLLRMRRRELVVPFAALWQRVHRQSEARRLWKHLRRLLSWLLQILLLALLVLALGDPRPDHWLREPVTLAIVLDRSASMGAASDPRQGSAAPTPSDQPQNTPEPQNSRGSAAPTRLDAALARARAELLALGPADRALVLAAGPEIAVLSPLSRDPSALLSGLDGLTATAGEADLPRALALAGHALDGQPGPKILLLTDGALDQPALDAIATCAQGPVPCAIHQLPGPAANVAITAFAARRYPGDRGRVEVLAELHNLGPAPAPILLEVLADGLSVGRVELELAPGEQRRQLLPGLDAARTRLLARITPQPGADPALLGLPVDDLAYAVVPPLRPFNVALITDGTNLFLEAALLALGDHVQLSGVPVADARPDHPALRAADLIFVDPGPEPLPGSLPADKHLIVFDPWRHPGAASPIALAREVPRPFITEQLQTHPILAHIVLKDVNIRRGTTFSLEPGDVALLRALGEPIAVLRDADPSLIVFGFDPRQTDLPLRTAFPLLVANLVEHFERAAPGFVASVPVGARRTLEIAAFGLPAAGVTQVEVTGPEGPQAISQRLPVEDRRVRLRATEPGIYRMRAEDGPDPSATVLFAVNQADHSASQLDDRLPELAIPLQRAPADPPAPAPLSQGPLWTLLLLLAVALLALEWATYHRRWTV